MRRRGRLAAVLGHIERSAKFRAQVKAVTEAERERVNVRCRAYIKARIERDPEFKLLCRLRGVAGSVRRAKGAKKADKTTNLIGGSIEEFKLHITSLFTDGMTWELLLAGEIEIDHIRPCCSFNLLDEAQQRACFHYSNLQPLWKRDNRVKGGKWDGPT